MLLVVESPHRDDAAFSLGLAIDTWLAAGHTVSVLNCFTRSTYAPFSDVESLHSNDRASFVSALRKREDETWRKLAGPRLTFHDLDLLDAPLRLTCPVEEVLTVPVRSGDRALARVEGALSKLLRKAGSASVALVAPLALGNHIDHRLVCLATLQACAGQHHIPLAFYEDLPYAAALDEAAISERVQSVPVELQSAFAGQPESDALTAERRKSRLGSCYDSQIDSAMVAAIASCCVRHGGRERFWCNAAWREAGLAA